jgi:hypothetical chaperone protein
MDRPSVFAIDFGTSNSLLAAARAGRVFDPAPLDPQASDPTVLKSALHFTTLRDGCFGSAALARFLQHGMRGRLIRSVKRHLASVSFSVTRIGDEYVTLEQIIGQFLRSMRERACTHWDVDVRRVVLGRPARFSSDDEADRLAETRLCGAARVAGFDEVVLCPEPVAAAYDFADELDEPRLVLVADLGGGTSDYTLVRMHRGSFRPEDVLAVGGVAVAGDAIDGALVRHRVAPELGSRARYRAPFGHNVLDMPADLVDLLCSPADLTLLDRRTVLRRIEDIRAGSIDDDAKRQLGRLAVVIEDAVGFGLYDAVEAAKRTLSDVEASRVVFDYPAVDLDVPVSREALESAARVPVDRIVAALDQTLDSAGVSPSEIDIACLTGGTSRVPMVEARVRARLPRAQVRHLSSFHSVVHGLARKAEEVARGVAARSKMTPELASG